MTIRRFAEKHKLDIRAVDYWTRIGLLHPDVNARNGYRDYGLRTEGELDMILVAIALDEGPVEDVVNRLEETSAERWRLDVIRKLKEKAQESSERFAEAIERAEDILLEKEI